jgi:hypothetical protein
MFPLFDGPKFPGTRSALYARILESDANRTVLARILQTLMRLTSTGVMVVGVLTMGLPFGFAAGSGPIPRTEVIIFSPLTSANAAMEGGHCWTESIAVSRPGAWRCMRGNSIYDPCFEVASRKNEVVCGANPVRHKKGFPLMLTQPLPSRKSRNLVPEPWLIELADGSVCEAATGTMALIDNEPVRYPCDTSPAKGSETPIYCGLLGRMHQASVWMADKVCYTLAPSDSGPPFKLQNHERVTVRRVWE